MKDSFVLFDWTKIGLLVDLVQVDADIEPIDLSEVEKEVTVVRVRGNLTLTCSQNETELGNVFKYLLEKVTLLAFEV